MFSGVLGKAGRGTIPSSKLQRFQDADFFQKNTTKEKGWTFNPDGSIVEYKLPKISKDLTSSVTYGVNERPRIEH